METNMGVNLIKYLLSFYRAIIYVFSEQFKDGLKFSSMQKPPIWMTIYRVLAFVSLVFSYVVYGVLYDDFQVILLIVIIVCEAILFALNRLWKKHDLRIIHAYFEAILIFFVIWWLNAWGAAGLWLLFMFPLLLISTMGNYSHVITFLAFIAFIPPIVEGWIAFDPISIDHLALFWLMRMGYFILMGFIISMLIVNTPSSDVSSIADFLGEDIQAINYWDEVARKCIDILPVDHVRIIEFRAFSGEAKVVGTYRKKGTESEAAGSVGTHYKIPGDSPLLHHLRRCDVEVIKPSEINQTDRIWLAPWILDRVKLPLIVEPTNNDIAYIFITPIISHLPDKHLLGFLITERVGQIFLLPRERLRELSRLSKDLASSIATIMGFLHQRNYERELAYLADDCLRKTTLDDVLQGVVNELSRIYHCGCIAWRQLDTDDGNDTLIPVESKGVDSTNLRPILITELLRQRESIGTEPWIFLKVDPEKSEGKQAVVGEDAAVYFPLDTGIYYHRIVISLHIYSDHEMIYDLENAKWIVRNSTLLPTILSAVAYVLSIEEQKKLEKIHNFGRELITGIEYVPEKVQEMVSHFLEEDIGTLSVWCTVNGSDVKWNNIGTEVLESFVANSQVEQQVKDIIVDSVDNKTSFKLVLSGKDQLATGKTLVAIPLTTGDHPASCLVLMDNQIQLSNVDYTVFDVLQGYISIAYKASWTGRNVAALRKLSDLGNLILKEEDIREILYKAAESACALTGARFSTVQLVDHDDSKQLVIMAMAQLNSGRPSTTYWNAIKGKRIPFGVGITGLAAETKKAQSCDDVRELDHSQYIQIFEETLSELAYPLIDIGTGKLLGVLNVESRHLNYFTEYHQEYLRRLAILVSLGLKWAKRVQDLSKAQDRANRAEGLAIIGLLYGEDVHLTNNQLGAAYAYTDQIIQELDDLRSILYEKEDNVYSISEDIIDRTEEQTRDVRHNIKLTLELVDNIRRMMIPKKPEKFNIANLLINTVKSIPRGINIELVCDFQIEPEVIGFKRQVGQVFRVISQNAIEAMDGQGVLSLGIQQIDTFNESCVLVTISDTGNGIPEHMRNNLFELKPKRTAQSQGLGLAWVRLFLSMYGGNIDFNTSAKGTTMKIFIPRDVHKTADAILQHRLLS